MPYNICQRKPCRQPGIDYTRPGFYFVTICTKEKEEILGKVVGENMESNDYGRIVHECWLALPDYYRYCRLHEFVIMPNHVHGIVEIIQSINVGDGSYVGTGFKPVRSLSQPARSYSLSEILRAFKTFSSRTINQKYPDGLFQWQRSFHDRIIRDKGELIAIGRYIVDNPCHWADDEENLHVGEFDI
jgi:REP element-mobilizing transposase RayT